MKKLLGSFIIPLALFSLAVFVVASVPQKVRAQVTDVPKSIVFLNYAFLSETTNIISQAPNTSGSFTSKGTFSVKDQLALAKLLAENDTGSSLFVGLYTASFTTEHMCENKKITTGSSWNGSILTKVQKGNGGISCDTETIIQDGPDSITSYGGQSLLGSLNQLIKRSYGTSINIEEEIITKKSASSKTSLAFIGGDPNKKYVNILSISGEISEPGQVIVSGDNRYTEVDTIPLLCNKKQCVKKVVAKGNSVTDVTPKFVSEDGGSLLRYEIAKSGNPILAAKSPVINDTTAVSNNANQLAALGNLFSKQGQTIKISGQGFSLENNWVEIRDSNNNSIYQISEVPSSIGSEISFVLPGDEILPNGDYYIAASTNDSDWSNPLFFEIKNDGTPTPCYTFTRDLRLGSRDVRGSKDVENLQNFLLAKGFTIGDLTLGSSANKGYFGYATFQALKEYQKSIGVEATGYFGAITRASVNATCIPSYSSNLTIISPNGGESFALGQTIPLRWSSQTLANQPEQVLWTGLEFPSGAVCRIGSISSYANSINLSLVAGYKCPGTALTLVPGLYRTIVFLESDPDVRDTSDAYINVVSSNPKSSATITSDTQTTSSNPVISGTVSGNTGVGVVLSNSGGKVYGSGLIPVTSGKWSVTVSPALDAGKYEVTVYSSGGTKLTSGSLNVVSSAVAPFSGVINIITRLDGSALNPSNAAPCVSTLTGPSGSNTAGCARSLTNQSAGTYTLKWENGYPAGADTTKAPTITPVRFLGNRPAGENPVTFYVDFKSASTTPAPSTPTVSIISRLDGRVLAVNEIPSACAVSLSTPKGVVSGTCSRTVSSSGPGTYAARWYGSFPTGADTTKRPTVTGAQTLGTSNLVFYVDFASVQPSVVAQFISADTTVSAGTGANDDTGIFRIKYKVTANGGDVYIPSATNMAVNYIVDRAGVPVAASAISAVITNDTDWTKTSTGNFVIEEGTSETFTLTVNVQLGGTYTAGQYRTSLTGIKWGVADDSIPENTYTSLDGFKTSYVGLNFNDVIDPMRRPTLTAALVDTFKAYFFGY
ncbi:MAG: peptidoglycan-binding protein [Candidatus Pacebacteria bacterium]|nr:peptidoglycan-binding protein [Candidatus Paceibacterota bacterium]